MPLCSSWVHGVTAQLGVADSRAMDDAFGQNALEPTASNPAFPYCAKRFSRGAGAAETFYFAIPTPTVVLGTRLNLLRVLVMYDFDPGASIQELLVFDGPNELHRTGASRAVNGPGFDGVPDPTHDLEGGVNRFPIPGTPLVYWGLCLAISVTFAQPATIRFTAVGADFDAR